MERDGAHTYTHIYKHTHTHNRRAFSTEPWHLLRLISHETHVRDSRGREGEGVNEGGEGAEARDRVESKTGEESDVGPGGAAFFLRAGAPHTHTHTHTEEKKRKRLLINVQNNKLEVQSRTARTILLYRVYPALLSLSV